MLIGLGALIGLLVLALVVGFVATSGDYTVPATAADDPTVPTIELNGGVFHAETFGDPEDPVLIVVHGGPGADYRSLLDLKALSDDYFVVFYDQRGTGLSPRVEDPSELTYERYVDDLAAFVDHFGQGQPVNLLGHSFGGAIVTTYAGRFPDKVDHLVLAEPAPLTEEMAEIGPNLTRAPLGAYVRGLFEAFHIQNPPDDKATFDHVTAQIMIAANPGYWCNETPPDAVAGSRFSYDAYQNVAASFYDENGDQISAIEGIEQFDNEALFIVGGCNNVIGEAFQREQMTYFNRAQLVVIEGTGHEMVADQPEQSLAAVRAYLGGSAASAK
jgi:proline iminopeptidase